MRFLDIYPSYVRTAVVASSFIANSTRPEEHNSQRGVSTMGLDGSHGVRLVPMRLANNCVRTLPTRPSASSRACAGVLSQQVRTQLRVLVACDALTMGCGFRADHARPSATGPCAVRVWLESRAVDFRPGRFAGAALGVLLAAAVATPTAFAEPVVGLVDGAPACGLAVKG
jgi:hypothetical protein